MARYRFLILALGLTGCAQPSAPFLHVCPQAPDYPASFLHAAGVQLQGLPDGSPAVVLIEDYLNVLKEIKICKG